MSRQKCSFWLDGVVFLGLSPFVIIANQSTAWAGSLSRGSCPIPNSVADKTIIIESFRNSDCTKVTLMQDTTYYRYYNADDTYRFGRFLTTNLYSSSNGKTTLDAIQELALAQYFGPPPNLAQLRETVFLPAGTDVYVGVAGPQPPKQCYPGGASQVFTPDTRLPGITFTPDGVVPAGGSLPAKCYTISNSIPEPSPLFGIGAIATLGLATAFAQQSKTKQKING